MTHTDDGRERTPVAIDHTARIRELNDQFRRTFVGGIVAATKGFSALDPELQSRFTKAIQDFDEFSSGNDPYAEHDFGAITLEKATVFFKLDYYDCLLIEGSPDPADPSKTLRLLTIMLASEY